MARILAIDDDPSMRLLMERMLWLAGHEVELAADGKEGLARIRANRPDAVLCDINMPGIDGFGVLECVRADAATARLPFLFVSAHDDREHLRRGLRLGVDDYVSKPIDAAELLASVARALDKERRLSGLFAASALAPPGRAEEDGPSRAEAAGEALDRTLETIGEHLGDGRAPAEEPVIHGYKVRATIAQGGMSTTYIATQESTGRKAVLKILRARRRDDESTWKRFFQECAILCSMEHDHVVRIYDQGFGDQLAYIAMEYLAGGTLRPLIDRGLSERQAMSLLSQAASGLAEIHRHGIVHRDIKPSNLMLRSEGVLVLTDFGVAKRMNRPGGTTVHGEVLGTPYYLSPEQAEGGEITPATDLYSLGVVFYEMLTGQRPYPGGTMLEVLSQHMTAPVPRLPSHLSAYQPLVDGLLAKRPGERFPDGAAVLAEIDRIWTDQAIRRDQTGPLGGTARAP